MRKKQTKQTKGKGLNLFSVLLLAALVPLVLFAIALSIVLISDFTKELKTANNNTLVSTIEETGNAFDSTTENTKTTIKAFISAPIIKECLKNPDDPEIAAQAEQYTTEFFGNLDGWEGIYLADWNSKVLTHPAAPVIGKVMREGDRLKELQDAMLSSEDGIYNVGIISSPASGELVMSMYAPVYDGGKPIGYVGGGTYLNQVAEKFSDVSSLKLESAYTYFVGPDGTMLYHPDETKIGNPVENEAVVNLVAKLQAGEHPEPACVEYKYKGNTKYAAYYVGENNHYIAVLTADSADALEAVNSVKIYTAVIAIIMIAIFSILSLIISKKIAKPLSQIASITQELARGNVNININVPTIVSETIDIRNAAQGLQNALNDSIGLVKNSAKHLDATILEVTDKTSNNANNVVQINMAIDEVATTSQAVAENAQNMAEQASNMGTAIDMLSESIEVLKESADSISNSNEDASRQVAIVMQSSNDSIEAVTDITEKVMETNNAIGNISDCVAVIEAISAQTNLLSLNASIEAARAGEAGRGFAVVAEEIRNLADSSAASSQEIKDIIDNVSHLSEATVASAERVSDITKAEQEHILDTQQKFAELSEAVENSLAQIESIKDMADSLDQIKSKLVNATNDLGAISEELGASAEEVSATCHTVAESCDETKARTEDMQGLESKMIDAIDFFQI